jgi:hypothetical protein
MNFKLALLAAAFIGGQGVLASSLQVVLCKRGHEAKTAIVLPDKPEDSTKYAAEELQRCVDKMTDVRLPILSGNEKAFKYEIRLVQTGEFGTDGFRLRVENSSLEISGGKRGILYGVYELLEKYGGCGWYASWHEVIPRRDALAVPADLDDTQKPAFELRMPTWQDVREDAAFSARLRVNGHACDGAADMKAKFGGSPMSFVQGLGNCHTFGRILPPGKYFKDHPDVAVKVEAQIVAKLTGKDEPKKDDLADMRAPAPTAKARTAAKANVEVFADDFEDDD